MTGEKKKGSPCSWAALVCGVLPVVVVWVVPAIAFRILGIVVSALRLEEYDGLIFLAVVVVVPPLLGVCSVVLMIAAYLNREPLRRMAVVGAAAGLAYGAYAVCLVAPLVLPR